MKYKEYADKLHVLRRDFVNDGLDHELHDVPFILERLISRLMMEHLKEIKK